MSTVNTAGRESCRQAGLSLVEVFVALLVLSVGLIALARLQVDLVRAGGDSRARAAGVAIAEAKLEDLRTFSQKQAAPGVTWPVASTQPVAWSMIANNAGGRIASGAVSQAGVVYNMSWTAATQSTDGPVAGGSSQSFYKDVAVNVGWTGPDGIAQTVTVTTSIPDTPPSLTLLASQAIAGGNGPGFVYTPGLAPEVIGVPIDLGTGKRETTKPLPDVQARGDYSHEVSFSVVNYHSDGSDNVVDRREEFVTVNCRCELRGEGLGRTPARVAFTGTKLRDAPGKVVARKPQTGVVLETGGLGRSGQPALCGICCRDHHDGPAETLPDGTTDNNRYQPAGPIHSHFRRDSPTPDVPLTATGAAYDEACRLKRINGVFQVFEDWNLKTLTVARDQFLQTDPGLSTYVTYVQQYVRDYVDSVVHGTPTPTPTTTKPSGRDFPIAQGANAQLLGRGIYIDRMPANLVAFIADRIREPDFPYLEYVPFYEVNLTKLADWSVGSTPGATSNPCVPSAGTILCVTNQPIVDEALTGTTYSRGKVYAASAPAVGSAVVSETAKTGNTGLTGTFDISTPASATQSDSVTVGVTAP